MTKHELIRNAAKTAGVTQTTAQTLIQATLDIIADSLATGDSVKLQGFGRFHTKQRKGRSVVDFTTGERTQCPAAVTIAFTPAKALKQRIGNTGEG